MTNSEITPTAEQQQILDAFATGESLVIEAGAGTGKTSTLKMIAASTDRKGLYLVYNKKAAYDAKKKFTGTNTEALTTHSLANKAIRTAGGPIAKLLNRLNGDRVPSKDAINILGIPSGGYRDGENQIAAWIISRSALEAVKRFCGSADEEINWYHVPAVDGIENNDAYRRYVVQYARKAWEDINSPNGRLTFEHDHYLKIWALTNPVLDAEFILLDEAQDTAPVLEKIVMAQSQQKVVVGDRCQALYEWRGAVDAMTNFACDQRLMLTQSFRFGQEVADVANTYLDQLDTPLRLSGTPSIESKIVEAMDEPNAILCRTNATAIEYAMQFQAQGKKVAVVGGTKEIEYFTQQAEKLQTTGRASHPDLVAFKSWGEVVGYSKTDEGADLRVRVSLIEKYGVPAILQVCAASVAEGKADLEVSTGHKAKGAEWDRVKIGKDFAPTENATPGDAELRLLYVAVTRAKLELDMTALTINEEVAA